MMDVFRCRAIEYEYVFDKDDGDLPLIRWEHNVHRCLERARNDL